MHIHTLAARGYYGKPSNDSNCRDAPHVSDGRLGNSRQLATNIVRLISVYMGGYIIIRNAIFVNLRSTVQNVAVIK